MQRSRAITRKSASNLALAFILLPSDRRQAMMALYAFCREVDDIADEDSVEVETRRRRLAKWREELHAVFQGSQTTPTIPVIQELQPAIQSYGLKERHFEELLNGVAADLEVTRYADYEELDLYCYQVASAVGLLSIPIFGYRDPACEDYAVHLGKALQLTNILRDVASDAKRGRIYLPASEMRKFQVTPDEILRGAYSARYQALAASVAQRARQFYGLARAVLPEVDRPSMRTAELMGAVYWRLLRKLENCGFQVFDNRTVRLSKAAKLALIARAMFRHAVGVAASDYGVR